MFCRAGGIGGNARINHIGDQLVEIICQRRLPEFIWKTLGLPHDIIKPQGFAIDRANRNPVVIGICHHANASKKRDACYKANKPMGENTITHS